MSAQNVNAQYSKAMLATVFLLKVGLNGLESLVVFFIVQKIEPLIRGKVRSVVCALSLAFSSFAPIMLHNPSLHSHCLLLLMIVFSLFAYLASNLLLN